MDEIKLSEKVINEQVLVHIGDNMVLLNNTLHRKFNWTCHILRRNYPIHDAIEGLTKTKIIWKKKNRAPWSFEKQEKVLRAKGGS